MNKHSNEPTKHEPFRSIYRENFEVVEERRGKLRLYPHTEQLPVLLRALNLEFYGALPVRIARVDHRGDGFHKILLKTASMIFCTSMNSARADQLRLFDLPNLDLVAKLSIVQQITEEQRLGPCHRFRFYAGADFFPEIFLSGKRIAFADHVLQRFQSRVPNSVGEDLTNLLIAFYGSTMVSMPVNSGRGFVVPYGNSILAFTYKESDTEFFITTCLTMNELNHLGMDLPPCAYNFHYGEAFTKPKVRNWLPTGRAMDLYKCWQRKGSLAPHVPLEKKLGWHRVAYWLKDVAVAQGHGPGSRICFVDHIPGPNVLEIKPTEIEAMHDELAGYKKAHPEYDWDAIFAEQEAKTGVRKGSSA